MYPDINVYRIREINSDKVRVVHRNILLSVNFLPVDEHQESNRNVDDVNVDIDLQENKVDRDDRTAHWILGNTDGFVEEDECSNCTDLPDVSDCVSEILDSASTDAGKLQDRNNAKVTSDVNVTSDVDLPEVGGQDSNSTQGEQVKDEVVHDEESVVCTQPRQVEAAVTRTRLGRVIKPTKRSEFFHLFSQKHFHIKCYIRFHAKLRSLKQIDRDWTSIELLHDGIFEV